MKPEFKALLTIIVATTGLTSSNLSLEKIIFSNFPIWLSVLIHKFLLLFVGFYGSYLLFNSAYKFEKIDSVFVASLITIFNPYTVTATIQHGLGYSVAPLAIFLILYQTDKKFYFLNQE